MPISDEIQVVLAEWKDLRDDINKRVQQRTLITQIMVALVSALIAAAFTANNLYLLGVVPFVAVFFMLLIKASYNRHRLITRYIRENIERDNLNKLFPLSEKLLYWETWFKSIPPSDKEKTNRRVGYNAFNLGTLIVCGTILYGYIYFVVLHMPEWVQIVTIILAILYGSVGGYAVGKSWIKKDDIEDP